ncbi:MAG: polysaccharide deacetylase family protein [Chthonomonadales bacterium]
MNLFRVFGFTGLLSLCVVSGSYSQGKIQTQSQAIPFGMRANAEKMFSMETSARKRLAPTPFGHGDLSRKEIAITFDDGPHILWTPALLDELRRLNVKVTFFVVGKMVDQHPELIQREVAEGHEVANHTYDHLNLTKLSPEQVQSQIKLGAEAIRRAVGYAPIFFRPPGGQFNASTLAAASRLGAIPVLWTANSKDFAHPNPDVLEKRLLAMPHDGGILLCHDGIPETMKILPDLVARLRAKGYTFVTVSELANHSRRAP